MPASKFVWYELMTGDPAAAEKFYDAVMGWTSRDAGMGPDMPYTLAAVGSTDVAGLMGYPPGAREMGIPPHWTGYIGVDDVDAMAARVLEEGGKLLHPATDIPGVGRFAVVADPQGADFAIFKGSGEPAPVPAAGTPGTFGWNELVTSDWEKAFGFYSKLFGWTKDTAVDMGPMGTYQLFAIDGVGQGGMMNRPAEMPGGPGWQFYVNVPEIESAVERIKAGGGTITHGPAQVPGGSWIVNAIDPQGAVFCAVAPGKA